MGCEADTVISNFELEKQKSICCSTKAKLSPIVKELLLFTCSYPLMVQGAKGLIGHLACVRLQLKGHNQETQITCLFS